MKLEEALKKYSIDVPSKEMFYSKVYQEYFKNKSSLVNGEFEKFRNFQNMYNQSFLVTFGENVDSTISTTNKRAVILGGQTGAGKSGLVGLTLKESKIKNEDMYIIDDDQFRKFYPYYKEIMAECPEFSTILTAIGSGPVTPKIMKFASDNGFNFIFDGTMKNSRILDTAQTWEGYDIIYRVMATPRIESLLSIFERNAYLRQCGFGRPVSIEAHDETYYGLEKTLSILDSQQNANVEVYIRGNKKESNPRLIYSSTDRENIFGSSLEALQFNRRAGKENIELQDIYFRLETLETSQLSQVEIESIKDLRKSLREEIRNI